MAKPPKKPKKKTQAHRREVRQRAVLETKKIAAVLPAPPEKPKPEGYVFGRPTLYRPEYCAQLVRHMEGGLSFESFAGEINVNEDTLTEWVKRHEHFSVAKSIGRSKNRTFWERASVAGMTGMIDGFNATVWIFSMKNRFGWKDKQEITGSISIEDRFDRMTNEELDEYIRTGKLPTRKDEL